MATTIQIKRSSTASGVPLATDLAVGELAVNLADKRLFTKQSDGTIIELSTNPTDLDAATLRIDGVEITASATELNSLDGLTATTAELNILDGVTATTAELNYVDGVTSNIQTQLNSKANLSGANFTGNVDVAGDLSTDGLTVDDTTGTVVIDAGQFVVRNPDKDANIFWSALGGDSEQTAILGHGSGTKLQTTATGIDVTGDVSTDTLTIDGTTVTATATELNYTDGVTSNIQTQLDGKATSAQGALADSAVQTDDNVSFGTGSFSGEIAANGGIALGDNDKATFGASADLQIYHDGSNSYIDESGTGNLHIKATNLFLEDADGNDFIAFSDGGDGGTVYLKHFGNTKLNTTGSGVDVTGTVTADAVSVTQTGSTTALRAEKSQTGQIIVAYNGASVNYLDADTQYFRKGDGTKLGEFSGGDFHLYEDTGTTAKFVWDSSAESLSVNKSNNGTPIRATGTTSGANEVTLDLVDSATGKSLKMLASGASYNYAGISGSETALYTYGTNLNLSADGGEIKLNTGSAGAAVERMRIDSSGNVGIGTDNPIRKLHIYESGTGNVGVEIDNPQTGEACTIGKQGDTAYGATSVGDTHLYTYDSNITIMSDGGAGNTSSIKFATGGSSERARINSSGNLLLGTTANPNNAKLQVGTYGQSYNGIEIGGYANNAMLRLRSQYDQSSGGVFFERGTVTVGTISFTSAGTSYNTSSDKRLKENIQDTTHTVDINDIRVREFDWIEGGEHQRFGFIAQELETVYPEAVSTDDSEEQMKSVDYSKLVPLLVKEIQTLKARIETLENN